jgi:flavin-dependent dehydrogenase
MTGFDVAVIGGGPAGGGVALGLARRGRRVLVLDKARGGGFAGGEALPPLANPLLRRLGLDVLLRAGPHLPCHGNRGAWGSAALGETEFLFSPYGHGWHLHRAAFDASLLGLVEDAGGVVLRNTRLAGLEAADGGWSLAVEGAEAPARAAARFLIDASGLARVALRRLGVPILWHDHQVARIGRFRGGPGGSGAGDPRTLVEAVADGWWYTARMPGGEQVAIAFGDARDPWHRATRSTAGFLAHLAGTCHVRRSILDAGARQQGPLLTRAAPSTLAARVTGPGWLAVGDAAFSLDPLSSQGLLTALSSAEQAVPAVLGALDGDLAAPAAYARHVGDLHRRYLAERQRYYATETRWPERPFWRMRVHPEGELATVA